MPRTSRDTKYRGAEPGPYQMLPSIWSRFCDAARRAAFRPGHAEHQSGVMASFFVYILANKPRGVLYVGITNDPPRRISEHRSKIVAGFTSRYGVTRLVYLEEHTSLPEARARERSLKRWQRIWKFELIEKDNPTWRDLTDELL